MARTILTDYIWEQLETILVSKGCYKSKNNHNVMEAIFWKLRTGAQWSYIPEEFCSWSTAYNRFNRWAKKGLWDIFFYVREEVDTEWVSVDGSYIRAHQHASGARSGEYRAIGKSRGGPTTKIHMATDALGNPIHIEITGGQVHDSQVAEAIIENIEAENLLADKGYDSEKIREKARDKNIIPMIPRRSNSKKPNSEFDRHIYKARHQVENIFARLKHFRSIATRFEKLARNFKAIVTLACTYIWLKLLTPESPVK